MEPTWFFSGSAVMLNLFLAYDIVFYHRYVPVPVPRYHLPSNLGPVAIFMLEEVGTATGTVPTIYSSKFNFYRKSEKSYCSFGI